MQDEDNTEDGIAIHRYGSVIAPVADDLDATNALHLTINGVGYTCSAGIQIVDDTTSSPNVDATAVGDKLTFSKDA